MAKFGEIIDVKVPVVILLYAIWNMQSNDTRNQLKEIASEFGDNINAIEIDVDKNLELIEALRVKGLPTVIIYHNGKTVWRKSKEVTQKEINDVLIALT